jgi:AraC-like DNA-binding protein
VDDDPAVREALACGLADYYRVHTAATGTAACACLRVQPIAVVILDIYLGYEDGLDFVPRFRALSMARILVLTGRGTEAVAVQALRVGVDDYLKKPVALPDLRASVDRLLAPAAAEATLAGRARQALDAHPPKPFRAAAFAQELGVSEMNLRRAFRTVYGTTPHQYLTGIRLERAAALLRTTAGGVAEIAFDVGFPEVAWFTKCFRHRFGLPPGAYRSRITSSSHTPSPAIPCDLAG